MKPLSILALGLVFPFALASSARACDLQNKDGKSYDVKFTASSAGAIPATMTIPADTTIANMFSGSGTLEVVGVGSMQVDSDDVLILHNGKLTKR